MMNKNIELLAPAGDLEKAKTAIRFGADAVYLGGKRFSLRSRASNFEIEDIAKACEFAKKHGANIHVTVNMIPHEEDLDGIEEYLMTLERIGVKAIIVASVAIIEIAKRVAPGLEIHLSTQMSTTNLPAIEFYRLLGADRVVLARECSIEQVKYIAENASLSIEAFIHGGMCVNYSGRCTLSNQMTFRDANRGGCAQSCRWKYHLFKDGKEISHHECLFSMSSKDLMAVDYVYDMMASNVASLKIEGRMKTNYYIATVVKTYRMLIDEIAACGTNLSPQRLAYYRQEIAKAENRPCADGFYGGLPTNKTHLYGVNGSGVTHDFVGVVLAYDAENKLAKIQSRNVFKINDELEVFGPHITDEPFTVTRIIDQDGQDILSSNRPMAEVFVPIDFKVEPLDMIRRR